MKKEFAPYNMALRLKNLGFDEVCFGYYESQDKNLVINFNNLPLTEEQKKRSGLYVTDNINSVLPQWAISAPTFSRAFKWFREKHNLYIKPDWCWTGDTQFLKFQIWKKRDIEGVFSKGVYIFKDNNKFKGEDEDFYYKAEIACLDKLLEIVEQN